MSTPPDPHTNRRTRGSRAGLSRARIIEAARGLDAGKTTMKAVADRLGVDRSAIHHHIADLDTLRELMAFDAFTASLAPVSIPADANWRDACRLLALSMHQAVLNSQGLGVYIRLTSSDVALLEPVEQTLGIMESVGFDDETAARSLATLGTLAAAVARERLIAQRPSGHPQVPELRQALNDSPADKLHVLRRLAQADLVSFNDAQLEIGIDLVLDGMAARLLQTQAKDV